MKRDHSKTVQQAGIPAKVVMMAKAIIHADAHGQQVIMVQAKATGRQQAYRWPETGIEAPENWIYAADAGTARYKSFIKH